MDWADMVKNQMHLLNRQILSCWDFISQKGTKDILQGTGIKNTVRCGGEPRYVF